MEFDYSGAFDWVAIEGFFKRVVVCGSGNSGLVLVADLSLIRGLKVRWFVANPGRAETLQGKGIVLQDSDREIGLAVTPDSLSSNPAEVIPGAGVVFLAIPMNGWERYLKAIAPHIHPKTIVVGMQCQTSLPRFFRLAAPEKALRWAAMDMLPYTCRRTADPENEANVNVALKAVKARTLLFSSTSQVEKDLTLLFRRLFNEVSPVSVRWDVHMVPTNCLFHTAFMQFYIEEGKSGKDVSNLFYRGVNDEIVETILGMSRDLSCLMAAMDECIADCTFPYRGDVLKYLSTLYESQIEGLGISTLKDFFQLNPSYEMAYTPKTSDGKVDVSGRFVHEDVPFGLMCWYGVGRILGVETPAIREMIVYFQKVMGKAYINEDGSLGEDLGETGAPQRFGVDSVDGLRGF